MVEEQVRADLPGEPVSVGRARRVVRDALRGWGLDADEETAVLLVSELATNAVLHARSRFAVDVARTRGGVRISVSDCSPAAPAIRSHGLTAGTGRGMAMVEQLSARWGTTRADAPYAKTVWFELPTAGR